MVPTISLHMTSACQGLRSSADKFSAVVVVTTNSNTYSNLSKQTLNGLCSNRLLRAAEMASVDQGSTAKCTFCSVAPQG